MKTGIGLFGLVVLASGLVSLYIFREPLFAPRKALVLPAIVEEQEIRLCSKIGGRIEAVYVSEGDSVQTGTLLAKLESPELLAQLAQLQAVRAAAEAKLEQACNGPLPEQIESARAAVAMAESQLANLKAGSRSEEIAQAKLDVSVRTAEELRARRERDRLKPLLGTNSISSSDMDLAQAIWQNAEGQLGMAKERLSMLEAGHRPEVIAEAAARLRKAHADLALVERGTRREEIKQLEAMRDEIQAKIREVEVNLDEATIEAPNACIVEVIPVRAGDMVQPNQPILRVRQENDLWIKAYVPETDLGRVKLNQSVVLKHDHSKRTYSGKIIHIASASEFTPRNVQSVTERQNQVFAVKIRPQGADGVFKSGMAAEVVLPLTDEKQP